ncbi:MAG: HAMP domain-containing protein, partial [Fibrobacter sp.]|nr:HAMP domain-containing protein [Fibrobacter sp.]
MNVFFLVIVSKLENVNRISLILKRQNEVKNYMLRLKTLHRVRGPSVISYERVGLSESVQNFRDMHKKFTLLLDTIGRKIDTVLLLDSIVMHNTLYATQPGTNNEILKNAFNSIGIYNNIYASTFDSIVAYKNVPSAQKKISAWRGANNDADLRVASTIDSVENNIEQRTNVHIKDVEIQVKNVQNITWIIIIGVTLFGSIFALFFSRHITIALRRLKESASTIGKGDFDVAPTGYPNDEIGDLATAFFEMAVDLKNTQDELIKSKR